MTSAASAAAGQFVTSAVALFAAANPFLSGHVPHVRRGEAPTGVPVGHGGRSWRCGGGTGAGGRGTGRSRAEGGGGGGEGWVGANMGPPRINMHLRTLAATPPAPPAHPSTPCGYTRHLRTPAVQPLGTRVNSLTPLLHHVRGSLLSALSSPSSHCRRDLLHCQYGTCRTHRRGICAPPRYICFDACILATTCRWLLLTWGALTSTWAAPRPSRCRAAWGPRCCGSRRQQRCAVVRNGAVPRTVVRCPAVCETPCRAQMSLTCERCRVAVGYVSSNTP